MDQLTPRCYMRDTCCVILKQRGRLEDGVCVVGYVMTTYASGWLTCSFGVNFEELRP